MKSPTKPPAPPPTTSGRSRKDVNYAPTQSEPAPAAFLDSGDDATPMRQPTAGNVEPISPATSPVEWKPAPPPPSQRHFAPPPSTPHVPAISSARVRQSAPMEAPPYSSPYPSPPSQQGPVSQQQITGPQLPVPMHLSTGPFPAASGIPAPRPPASPEEGMHLGYVVASAFFLAIALVGIGLYLAFEVISL